MHLFFVCDMTLEKLPACAYLCILDSMCVLPGYKSSDSEFLCRTARLWSQQVSDPHLPCCADANHHCSKHTDWQIKNRGSREWLRQWRSIVFNPSIIIRHIITVRQVNSSVIQTLHPRCHLLIHLIILNNVELILILYWTNIIVFQYLGCFSSTEIICTLG